MFQSAWISRLPVHQTTDWRHTKKKQIDSTFAAAFFAGTVFFTDFVFFAGVFFDGLTFFAGVALAPAAFAFAAFLLWLRVIFGVVVFFAGTAAYESIANQTVMKYDYTMSQNPENVWIENRVRVKMKYDASECRDTDNTNTQ